MYRSNTANRTEPRRFSLLKTYQLRHRLIRSPLLQSLPAARLPSPAATHLPLPAGCSSQLHRPAGSPPLFPLLVHHRSVHSSWHDHFTSASWFTASGRSMACAVARRRTLHDSWPLACSYRPLPYAAARRPLHRRCLRLQLARHSSHLTVTATSLQHAAACSSQQSPDCHCTSLQQPLFSVIFAAACSHHGRWHT